MTQHTKGWTIAITAFGVLLIALGTEVAFLETWADATKPAFVSKAIISFGSAIGTFMGGKMIPAEKPDA